MSQERPGGEEQVYDIIGVGFGPSNLALAIAVAEHNSPCAEATTTARFLERQGCFGWHRGMLIDDATMQVSFLKDLVTLRNPSSEFSFLSYLHSRGRLVDFINHKNLYPLRIEFHDYFEWAAAKFGDDVVDYGREVFDIQPVARGGVVSFFDVVATVGDCTREPAVYRARNLVFGMGLEPRLPDGVAPTRHVWHNSHLLGEVERIADRSPRCFIVVGAGQSAAEATAFLHRRFPEAEVCAVFSRYGYSPADDSSFANRVFDPAAVDEFYGAPRDVKRMVMEYHRNTNYSVVDQELIDDLYRRAYQEKVLGTERLRIFNVSRLAEVVETGVGVRTVVESMTTGDKTVLEADALVYATGYREVDPAHRFALDQYCCRDEAGGLRVGRDYRAVTVPGVHAGIYLQGGTEHTHGISSSLLSNTAVRAGEIMQSVMARQVSPGSRVRAEPMASGVVA